MRLSTIDVENDKFSIPPWKTLMQFRVVVTSCLDAGILVSAQCTNTQLMAMEDEVAASIHPHRKPKHIVQPHWTHLLIDEVRWSPCSGNAYLYSHNRLADLELLRLRQHKVRNRSYLSRSRSCFRRCTAKKRKARPLCPSWRFAGISISVCDFSRAVWLSVRHFSDYTFGFASRSSYVYLFSWPYCLLPGGEVS